MFNGNGIYDKPSSSGEHEMFLLAKSQFFKPSKNIYEFMPSDWTCFIITVIKRIFINVSSSRLKVIMNLYRNTMTKQDFKWQWFSIPLTDRLLQHNYWLERLGRNIYAIGAVDVCLGDEKQDLLKKKITVLAFWFCQLTSRTFGKLSNFWASVAFFVKWGQLTLAFYDCFQD